MMLGLPLTGRGPSYTAMQLASAMVDTQLSVDLYSGLDLLEKRTGDFTLIARRPPGPPIARKITMRLFGSIMAREAERRLLARLECGDQPFSIYTFGETSLAFSRRCNALGLPVVREKFNCAKLVAREILAEAYAHFGQSPEWLSDELIAKEQEELHLADAIFCPSPMVATSLKRIGIPEESLLHSSYGWNPARFGQTRLVLPDYTDGPTLIFVGSICVRKGAHLLLEAWARAGIKGRLVLVGNIEELISERFASSLARDDVIHVPFTSDIASYFHAADWFVFPSLEEGDPLVTHEAGGCGLPMLLSPMGAGSFAQHEVHGLIIDSTDVASWAEAIASLPDRAEQRLEFARNASARAAEFTYDKVGRRRRDQLLERFAGNN